MRKYSVILLCSMLVMFASACASTTITWNPEGNETTTLGLRTDAGTRTYLAIRAVDRQPQANPWTFYVPIKFQGQTPQVLGRGKDANVVEIEINKDYELQLGFFRAKGLLDKRGEDWSDSEPTITLKALESGKKYIFLVEGRGQIALGQAPAPAGQINVATLILKGGKGLFDTKVIQQWRIYTTGEMGKLISQGANRSYMVEEEEPRNGLF